MIAIAMLATIMTIGLAVGCAALDFHFDEQERRLKEKVQLDKKMHEWRNRRIAIGPHIAQSGERANRGGHPRGRASLLHLVR